MSEQQDVRATFLRFPRCTQHFWTWFTGKALSGQEPSWRPTWWAYLGLVLAAYLTGLVLSSLAISNQIFDRWLALLVGLALTVWASRTMILVIAHQCIHNQFSGSERRDKFCSELVTVLTVFQDAHAFKVEHIRSHHQRGIFATEADPPVKFLMDLGFRPGMTRAQLWRQAWWVFLTPGLYLRGFRDRLQCNIRSGGWRRVGFLAWISLWLSVMFWAPNGVWVFLLAFALPVIPVAQLSALLDKLGEHAWLTPPNSAHGPRNYHVSASWARFCGSPVPAADLLWREAFVAWSLWLTQMLFYHLPARLFVIVGDLPNHDFHHRYPGTPNWTMAAYARQKDVDAEKGPPYSEVWGMAEAVDRMFESLSAATQGSPAARNRHDETSRLPATLS